MHFLRNQGKRILKVKDKRLIKMSEFDEIKVNSITKNYITNNY